MALRPSHFQSHFIVEPFAKYPWHLLLTQMSIQAVEQALKKRWHVKVDGGKHQYLWLVHDAFSIAREAKVRQKDLRSREEKLNGQKGSFLVPPLLCLPNFWVILPSMNS